MPLTRQQHIYPYNLQKQRPLTFNIICHFSSHKTNHHKHNSTRTKPPFFPHTYLYAFSPIPDPTLPATPPQVSTHSYSQTAPNAKVIFVYAPLLRHRNAKCRIQTLLNPIQSSPASSIRFIPRPKSTVDSHAHASFSTSARSMQSLQTRNHMAGRRRSGKKKGVKNTTEQRSPRGGNGNGNTIHLRTSRVPQGRVCNVMQCDAM